ncbi:MAG: hypothetical protein HGA97_08845 [Chlorobiaceae bacterium]|nr:hypothetical protein [Chlorobiaceae bacterium]
MAVVLLCITVYLGQILSCNHALCLSNWYVPDGITLFHALIDSMPGFPWSCVGRRIGVLLVQGLPFRLLGVFGFFALNLLVVVWIVLRHGTSLLFLYPFYLLSLALPSKDLLMLLIILEWSRFLIRGSWGYALMLTFGMYFIRDGDMFISLACMFAILLLRRGFTWRIIALVAMVFSGFLFVYGRELLGHIRVYADYVAYYQTVSWLKASTASDYLIRVIGNMSNLAMRTVFVDDQGGINLLAVGYFISGISMLVAFCLATWSYIRNEERAAVLFGSLLLIVAVSVLSINPLVQPRYLLPYSAAFFMLTTQHFSGEERGGALAVTLVMTALGICLYCVLPIPRPPVPHVYSFSLF